MDDSPFDSRGARHCVQRRGTTRRDIGDNVRHGAAGCLLKVRAPRGGCARRRHRPQQRRATFVQRAQVGRVNVAERLQTGRRTTGTRTASAADIAERVGARSSLNVLLRRLETQNLGAHAVKQLGRGSRTRALCVGHALQLSRVRLEARQQRQQALGAVLLLLLLGLFLLLLVLRLVVVLG